MTKKVLIITYYWPPAGGPGVQRWLKFVKYLPEFGIEPIVFIPENPNYPIHDESILQEVPQNLTVLKTPIKEPYGWASALSRKRTKQLSSGIVTKPENQSLLQKLMLYIRGNCYVPDARVAWVKPSVKYLTTYLKENDIGTIITTGPPHSLHLIGLKLKAIVPNLQWIADFRDPWTTIGYHSKLRMTENTQKKHLDLERSVLQNADHIVVTSPTTKTEFEAKTHRPVSVITNGYDLAENTKESLNNKFTITHVGSLLSGRNPEALWSAISQLIKDDASFAASFQMVFAGVVSPEIIASLKSFKLEDKLVLKGYVSHQKAIELQQNANILLLIEIDDPETKSILPGKLYEYLAARRPILAVGPKYSDIEGIVKQTEAGVFCTYNQQEQLSAFIKKEFAIFKQGLVSKTSGDIKGFHRKELTHLLSNLLYKLWE